jgi:hypothetical protein
MMNERIRLLAEQATTKQDFYPAGCNGYPDYRYEFDKEKFAELIIRECIERVRDQYIPTRDKPNRTEREQGVVECGVASVVALEELVQESTDRWYKENILED